MFIATGQSSNPIGKLIDRQYLNAIGWRGIRLRKQNIESMLKKYANQLIQNQQAVRIMDIAAGHGRYILDAVQQLPQQPDSILLRDYSNLNVEAGQKMIEQRGLADLAQFVEADAFDTASLASVEPKPTLAVVSGLYELFSDNDLLRKSLTGLSQAIRITRLLDIHRTNLASTTRVYCSCVDLTSRRRCLGDASSLSSRNGCLSRTSWI